MTGRTGVTGPSGAHTWTSGTPARGERTGLGVRGTASRAAPIPALLPGPAEEDGS